MNIYLFDENRIVTFELPAKKSGNFWMKDTNDKNVINIIANENDEWELKPSKTSKIYNSKGESEFLILELKKFYAVVKNEKKYLAFADYCSDNTFKYYTVSDGTSIKVGSDASNNIRIPLSCVNPEHITINYTNKVWSVTLKDKALCYLNDRKIEKDNIRCKNGDIINIYGTKMLFANGYIFINNPFGNNVINGLEHIDLVLEENITDEEIENEDLYNDEDYYLKSPRLRKSIATLEMNIDSPPAKEAMPDTPLWVTLAPMLTMAASSVISMLNAISEVNSGNKTFRQILPTVVICSAMIFTMIIWPFITKKLEKKKKQEHESKRQVLYQSYIGEKRKELEAEYESQKRILEENLVSTDVCYDMIMNKRRTLWIRRNDQDDFLTVRVGIGSVKFDVKISYHKEDFTMDSDNLKLMLDKLVNYNKFINDVPISYSFTENIITGINGIYPKYIDFTNNLLLQCMAFHGYDELKIAVFTNDTNKGRWKYLMESPYCFSDDKTIRFFATNTEEMQEVSNYLSQIFEGRRVLAKNGDNTERISDFSRYYGGYFLIIIDDIDNARKMDIIDLITKTKINFGFSLIILEEKLSKMPSETSHFIVIGEKTSIILDTSDNNQTKFIEEIKDTYDMEECTKVLSNVPIRIETAQKGLPDSVTFLELFGVGKIEQLNVLNRWKENNPTRSLKAAIGINTVGDPFMLDLHEKAHGPHGLIAGMTGSGKSEFVISYVLSMAVNYSPEEVAFVLIDYKGGGLAGAFVDNETGKKLPHVIGTITNLDKTEINRALASINSELERRQAIFNEVRQATGEGTIDIYKYQKLYRDGVLKEPIPHLIIVSDEFAELKDQQPDFMEDLISTARIGRSLGVHLILATQKPSGVVDGQIWSNSKFKICLKVQDKQDSMEMIKNDMAAELKTVGRFYLLVGYSEYFATGQAAWSGAQYYPNDEFKKTVDKNLYIINNTGAISHSINNVISKKMLVSQGEELTNIVKYLIKIGDENELKIKSLWMDKIPPKLYLPELISKYKYQHEPFYINPIIGEYDDPTVQDQGLLTVNFNEKGNTLIYGANDSGKDEILQTLVYSLISNYSSEEVNLYLADFGAETLSNFREAPQVGDIVVSGDDEKVHNLSKLLNEEIVKRKKLFIPYGGNYEGYIKNSGKKLPAIVTIINSIETMNEIYNDITDKYVSVVRDGSKYGMYFVITTENQNSIKMRIAQSCKNLICLQLNTDAAYRDILGKTNGLIPTAYLGRGLTKVDRVCEFQTASIDKDKDIYTVCKDIITELKTKNYTKAVPIRVMPETIEISGFMKYYKGLDTVPIGIIRDNLNILLYDFKKSVANIISSMEFSSMDLLIKNFMKVISLNDNFSKTIIDANSYFETFDYKMNYYNNDLNKPLDELKKFDDAFQEILQQNNMNYRTIENSPNHLVVIFGFDRFYKKLDDEHKKIFQQILSNNKEFPKINFIFLDIPSGIKKYEYEEWYKNSVDNNNGIWIGQGMTQQFVIKTTVQSTRLSSINNDSAIIVNNGLPTIIKIINEIK